MAPSSQPFADDVETRTRLFRETPLPIDQVGVVTPDNRNRSPTPGPVDADALRSYTSMTDRRSLAPPLAGGIDLSTARASLRSAAAASNQQSAYCVYFYHPNDLQDGDLRDVRAGIMRGKNTLPVHKRRTTEGRSDCIGGPHSSASRGVHTQMGVPTHIKAAMHHSVGNAEMTSQGVVANSSTISRRCASRRRLRRRRRRRSRRRPLPRRRSLRRPRRRPPRRLRRRTSCAS
jgi:hypothetical protein